MDLKLREEDLAFQEEVRAFIAEYWPEDVRAARSTATRFEESNRHPAEVRRWIDALNERSWAVPNWPKEWGGTDWTPTQKYLWDRETAHAECPQLSAFGARMLAPVLYTWGTDEQKNDFLPKIREERMIWCQGYSEPGAGSDLAALSTRAVRDGDDYVVNGTKIWTSGAHVADWMFCLVRTDNTGKRQEGISFLLIDMKSPGITVNPIYILGGIHSVNEVELKDVRVPVKNLVGEENKGWTYAKGLLTHERTGIAGVARSETQIRRLRQIATETGVDGGNLWDDADFRRRLEALEIELQALSMTELRVLAQVEQGGAPGPESSILKIKGTELSQSVAMMMIEAFGYYGMAYPDHALIDNEGPIGHPYVLPAMKGMLYGRASTIFGGSNEIQKNIISKAVLGL
ncbi:MAG TPA: acyl-CoA dehydrogenase family protein [Pseudomonadales bacterium]|nr:acyl-CoA dehydrogenase family protein [Pseudomonadales bacterium]